MGSQRSFNKVNLVAQRIIVSNFLARKQFVVLRLYSKIKVCVKQSCTRHTCKTGIKSFHSFIHSFTERVQEMQPRFPCSGRFKQSVYFIISFFFKINKKVTHRAAASH